MLLSFNGVQVFGIVAITLVLIALLVFIASIRIVRQTDAYIIERLGRYYKTWTTGIHVLIPFIDRVWKKVDLREQVRDFDPQPVITKDNVTMQIDTVVYFLVTDPKAYVYGVEAPIKALENLTATTIRNIVGDLDLDETLTSREVVNTKMRAILDEATDPWGLKVFRVEVKNIMPPKDIRDSMEKQMRAERERREAILRAEGEKRSAILVAEGEKESAILRAEAKKEAAIREAEGEAKSILIVHEATAQGLKMIKDVEADKSVLTLKSYEALAEVSKGQATKIIIPSELQGIAGLAMTAKEVWQDDKK